MSIVDEIRKRAESKKTSITKPQSTTSIADQIRQRQAGTKVESAVLDDSSFPIIQEQQKDIGLLLRTGLNNLSDSPEQRLAAIQNQRPNLISKIVGDQIAVRSPEEKAFRVVDPKGITGLGEFFKDTFTDSIDDISKLVAGAAGGTVGAIVGGGGGALSGSVVPGAGTVAGGGAGAFAGGAGGSALGVGAVESAQEAIGNLTGFQDDTLGQSLKQIGTETATDAVLGLGLGAAGKVARGVVGAVLEKGGELLAGRGRQSGIDAVTEFGEGIFNQGKKALQNLNLKDLGLDDDVIKSAGRLPGGFDKSKAVIDLSKTQDRNLLSRAFLKETQDAISSNVKRLRGEKDLLLNNTDALVDFSNIDDLARGQQFDLVFNDLVENADNVGKIPGQLITKGEQETIDILSGIKNQIFGEADLTKLSPKRADKLIKQVSSAIDNAKSAANGNSNNSSLFTPIIPSLSKIKNSLVETLDEAVPNYKQSNQNLAELLGFKESFSSRVGKNLNFSNSDKVTSMDQFLIQLKNNKTGGNNQAEILDELFRASGSELNTDKMEQLVSAGFALDPKTAGANLEELFAQNKTLFGNVADVGGKAARNLETRPLGDSLLSGGQRIAQGPTIVNSALNSILGETGRARLGTESSVQSIKQVIESLADRGLEESQIKSTVELMFGL